jgi:hypothetical protein
MVVNHGRTIKETVMTKLSVLLIGKDEERNLLSSFILEVNKVLQSEPNPEYHITHLTVGSIEDIAKEKNPNEYILIVLGASAARFLRPDTPDEVKIVVFGPVSLKVPGNVVLMAPKPEGDNVQLFSDLLMKEVKKAS